MQYKISEFADMVGVSPQALKLYERKGIFLPSFVDPNTGYRYYDATQLRHFKQISELKMLKFSLSEIKHLLTNSFTVDEKIEKLRQQQEVIERLIKSLTYYKQESEKYPIDIRIEKPHTFIAYKLYETDIESLQNHSIQLAEELIAQKVGLIEPYYVFAEYTDKEFALNDISCILYFAVHSQVKVDGAQLCVRQGGKYLCTIHRGEYRYISAAYSYLRQYAEYNGIEIVGNPEERYILTRGDQISDNNYITEVRIAVK